MPRHIRILSILATVLVGVTLGLGFRWLWLGDGESAASRGGFGEVQIGGAFALTDQDGKPRRDDEFRGRLMLVNFGYTFCPDVCPFALQAMTDALDALGPQAERVQPIFISVDPGRDTPEVLKSFAEHFSPRLVALTGPRAEIDKAARAYRVYYRIAGDPAKDPNYLVDHTAMIYLMGPDGRYLTHFTHQTPPEKMAATIRRHL